MTRRARHEYAAALRERYRVAGKRERGRILDEFCRTTGGHRKAASRLLRRPPGEEKRRGGRPRRYGADVIPFLERLWDQSDRPCSKLLTPLLPALVAALERHGELQLPPALRAPLLALSPATLKDQIPRRTFGEWQDVVPGALQGDLVLHCGESTAGFYLSTLVGVDVASGWTEREAIWGLGQQRVGGGVHRVRQRLPFPLREWHTDNGREFLNRVLVPYCRREGIRITRGRRYRKNDQAYVEQKNWLAVRRLVGYDRYSSRAAYAVLQQLYGMLRLQLNFFRPLRKLVQKQRLGAKLIKHYDAAQTPYQRLLATGVLPEAQRQALEREYLAINPAALARQIRHTLEALWKLAELRSAGGTEEASSVTVVLRHHPGLR